MKPIQKQKRSLAKKDIVIHSVLSAIHKRTIRILEEVDKIFIEQSGSESKAKVLIPMYEPLEVSNVTTCVH